MNAFNFGVARSIAFTELRRRGRKLQDNIWQLIALGIAALFMIPFLGTMVFGLFAFGSAIGSVEAPMRLVRQAVIYSWVGITLFGGFRAYALTLQPDRLDGMLTTVSHRELVVGIFLAEFAMWGSIGGIVLLPVSAAFAAGAGSPIAIPLTFLAGGIVLFTAILAGFILALVIRNMGVRSVLLTRLRTIFLALLGIAYVAVFLTQAVDTVLDPLYVILASTPIGWIADLVMLGTSSDASIVRGIGAITAGLLAIVLGGLGMQRLAGALWYADGVHLTHAYNSGTRRARWLESLLPRELAGVVLADWTRARRAPITLSYALYPLFFLVWPTIWAIEEGEIGAGFALWILISGVWITGALFTLNIVGYEGAVLPVTLLADRADRALVGGHLLAGIVLGLPVTLVATLGFAVLGGHDLGSLFTLSAIVIVVGTAAPLLATGIGAVFPRFDEVTVTRSTKAVIPSTIAFGVYSLLMMLILLPGVLVHSIVGTWIADVVSLSPMAIRTIGTALSGLIGLSLGGASCWYALRRIHEFDLNR